MSNITYDQWLLGSLVLAALVPLFFPRDFIQGLLSGFFVSLFVRGFAFLYTHQTAPLELKEDIVAALNYAGMQARDPFLCALGAACVVGVLRKLWLRRHPQIGLMKVLFFKDYLLRFIFIAFGAIPTALALTLGPPLLGNPVIDTIKGYYQSIKHQALSKEIQEWVTSMRQQLPVSVDTKSNLVAINAKENVVFLDYTLTSLPNRGEEEKVLNERKETTLQTLCKKPSMLRIIENGGAFILSYKDQNGGDVGEFKISEVNCK